MHGTAIIVVPHAVSIMSAHWANRFTRWRPHYANETCHDLSHLHPFRYALSLPAHSQDPARILEIRVAFSSHCFTERCLDGTHDAPYSPNIHDPRKFCPERYELSKLLPRIAQELDRRRIYFNFKNSMRRNFITVDLAGKANPRAEYLVFFDVRTMGEPDAILVFIETAFATGAAPKPSGIGRQRVGFKVLVNLALRRQKPHPPA